MVKDTKSLLDNYNVKVVTEDKGDTIFWTIQDSKRSVIPSITVQFVNNEIYSVTFLNNEFFELPDDQLHYVLAALLQGKYRIKTSLLRKKWVVVPYGETLITPERTTKHLPSDYEELPTSFTRSGGRA